MRGLAKVHPVPDDKIIFDQAIEGLFIRALGPKMTSRCKARLKEAGLDLDQKLLGRYPLEQFQKFVAIAAAELYAGVPRTTADRLMGGLMLEGYGQTLFGRAVLGLLRLMGPLRSLRRLDQNFRAVNNFTESVVKELGPTSVEYWVNELTISPHFTTGLLAAGMQVTGAKDIHVEHVPRPGPGATFLIRWKSP